MSKVSYDYEHWSSPNGCAEGCPACANEERKQTDRDRALEEIAALHRLHAAAPALLEALKAFVADAAYRTVDATPGHLLRLAKARAAIALTEPCDHNTMTERKGDNDHAWQCAKCGYIYGKPVPHAPEK